MSNGVRDLRAIVQMFDEVFTSDFFRQPTGCRTAFDEFYTLANFPPTDLYVREDNKNWVFEFALAFYNEDEIDISFNGDYMHLKAEKKLTEKTGRKYIHKGVKVGGVDNNYYLPMAKFDTAAATATFKDGILTVEIPMKPEHQPKKLLINRD